MHLPSGQCFLLKLQSSAVKYMCSLVVMQHGNMRNVANMVIAYILFNKYNRD